MRLASTSALRLKASWIFFLISAGAARGLIWIRLLTPLTPLIRRTAVSAVLRWYCHSTWPSRVTQPFLTTTLMCSEEIGLLRDPEVLETARDARKATAEVACGCEFCFDRLPRAVSS